MKDLKVEVEGFHRVKNRFTWIVEDERKAYEQVAHSIDWIKLPPESLSAHKEQAKKLPTSNERIVLSNSRFELKIGGYFYGFKIIIVNVSLLCLLVSSIELISSFSSLAVLTKTNNQLDLLLVSNDIYAHQAMLASTMICILTWNRSAGLFDKAPSTFFEEKLGFLKTELLVAFGEFRQKTLGSFQQSFEEFSARTTYCSFLQESLIRSNLNCLGSNTYLNSSASKLFDQLVAKHELFITTWRSHVYPSDQENAASLWKSPIYNSVIYYSGFLASKKVSFTDFLKERLIDKLLIHLSDDIGPKALATSGSRTEFFVLIYAALFLFIGLYLFRRMQNAGRECFGVSNLLPIRLLRKNPWILNLTRTR